MRFEPSRGHQPDPPMPLLEHDDMTKVASPCHGFEPVKVVDDWTEALYGLVCGQAYRLYAAKPSPGRQASCPIRCGSASSRCYYPALPRRGDATASYPARSLLRGWAAGRDEARLPSWRPSTGRRTDRVRWEAATGEQPRDHRVRVPHLARAELVSAPDRSRQGANQVEQRKRALGW